MALLEHKRLYKALRDYTSHAMHLLAGICLDGPPELIFRGHNREWQTVEPGLSAFSEHAVPYWERCLADHPGERHELLEYQAVADAINADALAVRHVNVNIGTALGRQHHALEDLADRLLWDLTTLNQGFVFDIAEFDVAFAALISDLESTEIATPVFLFLEGFGAADLPIELEPDLDIMALSDNEVSWGLRVGVIRPFGLPQVGAANLGEVAGVRTLLRLPKVIGDHEVDATSAQEQERAARKRTLNVLEALRVFKAGRISTPGSIRLHGHGRPSGASYVPIHGPSGHWPLKPTYVLTNQESADFMRFWPALVEARSNEPIDTAIRRLNYAAERSREDDRLVDFVTAGETMFLSDSDPQELSYRYALRAAFFLDHLGARQDVFKFMRNTYAARSAIVHGRQPAERQLRSIDGTQLTLPEFVAALEDVLRAALRKVVEEHGRTGSVLPDWDGFILGSA